VQRLRPGWSWRLTWPDSSTVVDLTWSDLAVLWNDNDMRGVHDWLNERWAGIVASSLLGHRDPEAEFLQGIAFAAIALHFTQHGNQDGARLMVDDALVALAKFRPEFMGVGVEPILDTLQTLRPMLAGLASDDECPMQPFVYRKFEWHPVRRFAMS
jgi:hypothetical protein